MVVFNGIWWDFTGFILWQLSTEPWDMAQFDHPICSPLPGSKHERIDLQLVATSFSVAGEQDVHQILNEFQHLEIQIPFSGIKILFLSMPSKLFSQSPTFNSILYILCSATGTFWRIPGPQGPEKGLGRTLQYWPGHVSWPLRPRWTSLKNFSWQGTTCHGHVIHVRSNTISAP